MENARLQSTMYQSTDHNSWPFEIERYIHRKDNQPSLHDSCLGFLTSAEFFEEFGSRTWSNLYIGMGSFLTHVFLVGLHFPVSSRKKNRATSPLESEPTFSQCHLWYRVRQIFCENPALATYFIREQAVFFRTERLHTCHAVALSLNWEQPFELTLVFSTNWTARDDPCSTFWLQTRHPAASDAFILSFAQAIRKE